MATYEIAELQSRANSSGASSRDIHSAVGMILQALNESAPSSFTLAGAEVASGNDQTLTVDATVGGVQLTAFSDDCRFVLIDVQDQPARVTFDGCAPTTTNGHVLASGYSATWSKALAEAAKFIRDGGSDATVQATPLK